MYWLVVEGLRPEGERNPMVHCQALVVTSAATAAVRARRGHATPSPRPPASRPLAPCPRHVCARVCCMRGPGHTTPCPPPRAPPRGSGRASGQSRVISGNLTAQVRARVRFAAPSPAGDYTLRVHVASSTVVGVALAQEVPFTVQEDDVPELE